MYEEQKLVGNMIQKGPQNGTKKQIENIYKIFHCLNGSTFAHFR